MGGRDDVPLFDDETGEALNAAARQLADLEQAGLLASAGYAAAVA